MSKGNMLLGYARGKVGSVVFARRLGQQITKAYNSKPSDPKTRSQVEQRVKLANLIAMYRCAKSLLNHSFEGAKDGQTSYNLFVGANLLGNEVTLTKQASKAGACVVAPYLVSKGTYPPIQVAGIGADAVTNIYVGNLEITADTTVGQFSTAIIDNNVSVQAGDQLTYISLVQRTDSNTGYPIVTYNPFEVTLDKTSDKLLSEYMPAQAIAVKNSCLAHGALVNSGAFCWIFSRKQADGTLIVSKQRLILTANDINAQWTGATAITRAVDSYGADEISLLTPGSDAVASGAIEGEATPSISSVSLGGKQIIAGSSSFSLATGSIAVVINGSNMADVDSIVVAINGTNYTITDPTKTATLISGSINLLGSVEVTSVRVSLDSAQLFSASLTSSNDGDDNLWG